MNDTITTKNRWILTEERPKSAVLQQIFGYFAKDHNCGFFGDSIRIIPILDQNKCFDFTYEVIGFKCARISHVYIKTVSGTSSFTDFLIFYQETAPTLTDIPIYAIEETKTDDKESRNTGVYQRCSKFIFIDRRYPGCKKIMLYALQISQKQKPTGTYIFGTRLLVTYGVEILGKQLDPNIFKPFNSIEELISVKRNMRMPPKGNVPILIHHYDDKITISGRLYKSGGLSHDPNIGALSIISAVLRRLGWDKPIVITHHGLEQKHIGKKNKFIQIANTIGISIEGLKVPEAIMADEYWHYETSGEKLGTIFIHIAVENFTSGYSIFENHAGCEKGYFHCPDGRNIPLAKYSDREKYKTGDKTQIVYIPDLVLIDTSNKEIITIEGKKYSNMKAGIEELDNYDAFDNMYLKKYYPEFKIVRTVVLYGSSAESITETKVGFLLNSQGRLVLGTNAPQLFRTAIENLMNTGT